MTLEAEPLYMFRRAHPADIPVLVRMRRQQLIDEGMPEIQIIDREMTAFFHEKMDGKVLHQWVAEDNGEIIATAAFLIVDLPPNFRIPSGKRAYITNVYTAPAYRKRGLASRLIEILKDEAKSVGLTNMWLFASDAGISVYRKVGFIKRDDCMGCDL